MNQKALKKKKKKQATNSRRTGLPVVEEEVIEEELTFGDKLLATITPYLGTITFSVVAGFLAFALVAYLLRISADSKASQWRELSSASSISRQSRNTSEWERVAEKYPDSKAGLWASQFAGDTQLREGLAALAKDQKAGFGMIKKSKTFFQTVIDAPASAKTATLDQSSHFSLAYAHESLGEFAESKALYEKIISEAPDSPFVGHARRGLNRSTSGDYSDLYAKFTNWQEEEIGEAPGPKTPDLPSIDFPELPPETKSPATSGIAPEPSGGAGTTEVATEVPAAPAPATPAVVAPVKGSTSGVIVEPNRVLTGANNSTEVKPVVTQETKPAETIVVESVETAKPIVSEVIEGAGSGIKPMEGAVKDAASAVKEAAGAVTDAVVPPGK